MRFLTPKLKYNLKIIIPFGVIWMILGWLFLWVEHSTMVSLGMPKAPNGAIELSPRIVFFASLSVFLVGCLVGLLEVIVINKYFVDKSFPRKIISKLIIYSLILFLLMFVFYILAASIEMGKSVFDPVVFERYKLFITSFVGLNTAVELSFSLLLSLLYAEISDNIGQSVLFNFFTGRYHKPMVENRVFMFLDMKDSTEIAESLGHVKYFRLLRDYYDDLSDAIINNYGEAYQYIGDEIVISWKLKNKQAVKRSIQAYFEMTAALKTKEEWYLKTYGVIADFKAGIHLGEVTTGEIGAMKKEIFFTGDVLNTTARIQGLCKKYQVDILTTHKIREQINAKEFTFESVGQATLKGKSEPLELFTVTA